MKHTKGMGRVFAFTFARQTEQKGYRGLTLGVALLCFFVPLLVLSAMAVRAGQDAPLPESEVDPWEIPVCAAKQVCAVDETQQPITDWEFLRAFHPADWGEITYDGSADGAQTLLLRLYRQDEVYCAEVSLPEGSALTEEDVFAYESFLWEVFPSVLQVKSGASAQQLAALNAPIITLQPMQEDSFAGIRELLELLLPYVGVMLMYFLVLFYGQGVANSVVLEKSSKLMDFFLVSVEPVAMVMGKVLAIALSGLLQLVVWIAALCGGFAAGGAVCRAVAPDAQFALLQLFDSLELLHGLFSLPSVLLALGIIIGGFLIYCALSGVGGALAGKAEDLGSTNALFSMILVASFLCCLLSGGGSGMISTAPWLNFVPFTAILVTPARLLTGAVSPTMGAVTLAIVLATAAALCVLAGKVYRMMSLYKGDPPCLGRLMTMLKEHA